MTDTFDDLNTFREVTAFVKDLCSMFGDKNHPLKLYGRLIDQTQISHKTAIRKHMTAFREFHSLNKNAILEKNTQELQNIISYSEKVFIDIKKILLSADVDNQKTIWEHMIYISALLDPVGKAKDILKTLVETKQSDSGSTAVIGNIIDTISKNIEHEPPSSNPMEMVTKLMSSGVFTNLVNSMSNDMAEGKLDIGGLFSTLTALTGGNGGQNLLNSFTKQN